MNKNLVEVSVVILSYNHEKYIEQSIKSVLMQKTDFKFEIVIGDDASSDNTQNILKILKKKYSEKINLICRKKNIGATRNLCDIIKRCKGKYLALLESDDYWNDKYKLQKQYIYLEENKEYIACYSDMDIIQDTLYQGNILKKDFTSLDEYLVNIDKLPSMPTGSLFFRNIFQEEPVLYNYFLYTKFIGDQILKILLLQRGKIKYFNEKFVTYRFITKNGSSFSARNNIEKEIDSRKCYFICMKLSGEKYKKEWKQKIISEDCKIIIDYIKDKKLQEMFLFILKIFYWEKMGIYRFFLR